MDKNDASELYGRMMESCDIELAIESGQFKTVEDILSAVRARSLHINGQLLKVGAIDRNRRWTMKWVDGEATPVRLN